MPIQDAKYWLDKAKKQMKIAKLAKEKSVALEAAGKLRFAESWAFTAKLARKNAKRFREKAKLKEREE